MVKKKPERQTKNGFLPFLCPKNARSAFGVRNSRRNWILWFCPANMPRNTQKPGFFLAFAKIHPKHFWHFHDQKKKHQKHPNSKLITFLHPKAAEQQKEKEINVVASKKAPETPRHGYSCLRCICGHKKAPDTPRGRFSRFRPNGAPRAPQKWICLRFALTAHQKHPQNVFVLRFRPKSHRTR